MLTVESSSTPTGLWQLPEHAVAYLAQADAIPHRAEGEAALLEFLPRPVTHVLDLGSGDGRLLALVRMVHPHLRGVALDFSDAMIARLEERYYPDDRHVTIWDAVKLKTTWPADPETVQWQRGEDLSPDCSGSELVPFERFESVEGENVVVRTYTSRSGYRYTFWRAPKLACEPLYYRADKVDGDSAIVTVEKKTTRLILGDPDPQLFAISADDVETKPSEALMKAVLAIGFPLPEEARQQIAEEGAELDKRYSTGK